MVHCQLFMMNPQCCSYFRSTCPECKQSLEGHTAPDYAAGKQLEKLRKNYEEQTKKQSDEQLRINLKEFILIHQRQGAKNKKNEMPPIALVGGSENKVSKTCRILF